jgi:hypothetical protein
LQAGLVAQRVLGERGLFDLFFNRVAVLGGLGRNAILRFAVFTASTELRCERKASACAEMPKALSSRLITKVLKFFLTDVDSKRCAK